MTQANEMRPMPDHNGWPAFVLPWNDSEPAPTDISFLLEKPAGAHGFVQIVDGHLATGDGKRWRIWGSNVTFGNPCPPMEKAPQIARRLAKFGINCVRLHHIDRRWPRGIVMRRLKESPPADPSRPDLPPDTESTRALDPEGLARLDYFVYCCKQNGIYTDLNLNVSRIFTAGDGVKQAEWIGYAKALTYFDPQLIALHKEYSAQLLGHVNPFTGNRYAEEPAVALVELVNENSILESWVRNRLRGEQSEPFGTWGDIPAAYAVDLDRLWNNWVARTYPDRQALVEAWAGDLGEYEDPRQGSVRRLQPEDFASASAGRFAAEATFYAELECSFYVEMADFLRGSLGVRQIILGTSDHNHGINGHLHVENNALLGIVDGHVYWQHPRYLAKGSSRTHWTISNTPMVDDPDHSTVGQLARSRVLGLPYTVSETNQPFPNDYAAEYIPILAAYARLQDWDGIFFYCYGDGGEEGDERERISSFFSMRSDPVKMIQTAVGALTFLRGDVQAAQRMVERRLPHDWVVDGLRSHLPTDCYPFSIPHLLGRLALVHQTAVADFHAAALAPAEGEIALPTGEIRSDTGELVWLEGTEGGRVLIDTPRYQAIIGHRGKAATTHLELDLETPFAAVELTSLSQQPLSQAEEILLVTAARVANTEMQWLDAARQSLGANWGEEPTRIEPVSARVMLRNLNARQATLSPLDSSGQPVGAAIPLTGTDDAFEVALPMATPTLWYLITLVRE
jgi:hypothetical protein